MALYGKISPRVVTVFQYYTAERADDFRTIRSVTPTINYI